MSFCPNPHFLCKIFSTCFFSFHPESSIFSLSLSISLPLPLSPFHQQTFRWSFNLSLSPTQKHKQRFLHFLHQTLSHSLSHSLSVNGESFGHTHVKVNEFPPHLIFVAEHIRMYNECGYAVDCCSAFSASYGVVAVVVLLLLLVRAQVVSQVKRKNSCLDTWVWVRERENAFEVDEDLIRELNKFLL